MNPHRGAIALNEQGQPGLIIGKMLYEDIWFGIKLSEDGEFGNYWCSCRPEILDGATFHMADILETLKHNFDTTEKS